MCLDNVIVSMEQRDGEFVGTGYKFYYYFDDSYRTNCVSFAINTWYDAEVNQYIRSHPQDYVVGFHIVPNIKDAIEFQRYHLQRFVNQNNILRNSPGAFMNMSYETLVDKSVYILSLQHLVEVEYKNITAFGNQGGVPVIVAQKQKIVKHITDHDDYIKQVLKNEAEKLLSGLTNPPSP